MIAEFENISFNLKVGEISQPVQTTYGWHIIQVLGHDVRPLSETEYANAVNLVFNQWLSEQRTGLNIVVSGNWTLLTPDLPSLDSAFADLYATATAAAQQAEQQPTAATTP
jgi:hypothetical protein